MEALSVTVNTVTTDDCNGFRPNLMVYFTLVLPKLQRYSDDIREIVDRVLAK